MVIYYGLFNTIYIFTMVYYDIYDLPIFISFTMLYRDTIYPLNKFTTFYRGIYLDIVVYHGKQNFRTIYHTLRRFTAVKCGKPW